MIKKLNSLTILFLITLVMVVLMLITIQHPSDNNDDEGLLFPDLFSQLNLVDTLKFKSAQDEFTLFKNGEDWFVKERLNYPADFDLVKRALIDLSDTKILERKTDNPEQYPLLGVAGVEDGGESLTLTMLSGDKTIAGLILGNERETTAKMGAKQFYVRRAGEPRAWLAEGYLNINPLMLNWIKSEVLSVARERIAEVNIIQPTGETATLVNLGVKDKFGTPQSLDKTVFKYEQLGYDIAGTLFQLRMEDVQAAKDFSRGDAEVVTAEFITYDGLKVIAKTSFNDGFYFTAFHAEFDDIVIKAAPKDIQDMNVLQTPEQVKAEVATINKELSPWVYRFGGFVGTNLMRAKADMVTESENVIPMPADVMGYGS
jgi:hypothetical protein